MNKAVNRKLIKAYAKLIKKDSEKISVSLLCEKAEVARATFYIHHKDLDDFIGKLHCYLTDKFFEQATYLLSCKEAEVEKAVKKENFLLNENELIILGHMISGSNYIQFAFMADKYYGEEQSKSLFAPEVWEKHALELNVFSNGYLPMLILGITDYDEKRFRADVINSRLLFRRLCEMISAE